jgi:hypothetical protein
MREITKNEHKNNRLNLICWYFENIYKILVFFVLAINILNYQLLQINVGKKF